MAKLMLVGDTYKHLLRVVALRATALKLSQPKWHNLVMNSRQQGQWQAQEGQWGPTELPAHPGTCEDMGREQVQPGLHGLGECRSCGRIKAGAQRV